MNNLILSLVISSLISLPSLVKGQVPTSTKSQEVNIKNRVDLPISIDKRITTEQIAINVTTGKVSNITLTGAWCSYTLTSEGPVVQHGVCVNKAPAPTIDNPKYFSKGVTGPSFSAEITGLSPKIKYYVRAFAKNSNGTVFYGNELSFTTLSPK